MSLSRAKLVFRKQEEYPAPPKSLCNYGKIFALQERGGPRLPIACGVRPT